MNIIRWKDELFRSNERKGNQRLITTWLPEKAKKYGFDWVGGWAKYGKWVPISETERVGEYINRYRVKYRDHFFAVHYTRPYGQIMLAMEDVGQKITDELGFQWNKSYGPHKWIDESDTTEIHQIDFRIGYYKGKGFGKKDYNSDVYYILAENDTHYLLKEDSYIHNKDWTPEEIWVPKIWVFVYNESNKPLIY